MSAASGYWGVTWRARIGSCVLCSFDVGDRGGPKNLVSVGRSWYAGLVLAGVDRCCVFVFAFALGRELLRELVALSRRRFGAAEHGSPTARTAGASCDQAGTDRECRERDDAGDHDPAGTDGEGAAQHIHVDVLGVLKEDVDREARGDADE